MNTKAFLKQSLTALLLGAVLTACNQSLDLSAVSALATSVASSNDTLLAIPEDFYGSCVRQIGWSRGAVLTPQNTSVPVDAVVNALPKENATLFGRASVPGAAMLAATFDVTTACAYNKAASEQMVAVTTVLTSYFAAIGKLAATGTTSGLGIAQLGTAVSGLDPNAEFNKSGKTAAIAGALDGIASAFIAAKAKDDLAPDVVAADTLVGKLIDRLIDDKNADGTPDNVANFYLNQLNYERAAMHAFYSNNIGNTPIGLERLQTFQYYANEEAEDAKLDQLVGGVQNYVSALTKIKAAHASLAKAVAMHDFASAESLAQAYAAEFKPDVVALSKAFK
jgi:hypothetical protein